MANRSEWHAAIKSLAYFRLFLIGNWKGNSQTRTVKQNTYIFLPILLIINNIAVNKKMHVMKTCAFHKATFDGSALAMIVIFDLNRFAGKSSAKEFSGDNYLMARPNHDFLSFWIPSQKPIKRWRTSPAAQNTYPVDGRQQGFIENSFESENWPSNK